MSIGKMIKKRREELGWTQQDLADKMGYTSKSTITRIEKGYNDVSQSNIIKFADVLGVSPSYLMEWDNQLIDASNNDKSKDIITTFEKELKKLSVPNRENVLRYIEFLASQEHPTDDSKKDQKTL